MTLPLMRRSLLARRVAGIVLAISALTPILAGASDEAITLSWDDLWVQEGLLMEQSTDWGFKSRGSLPPNFFHPPETFLTTDYNGKRVTLAGFMLPLDYDRNGVSTFLLVPYVGACIHVPPPPPNQLVMVRADPSYDSTELFAPVSVTGTFQTEPVSTEFAEAGYTMQADAVSLYDDW